MKKTFPKSRHAFTLVEILVVIAIIIVLSAVTFGLLGPVMNTIRKTNAKTQIDKIKLALGDFKSAYGEYPMPEGSVSSQDWQRLLLDTMRGDKILVRRNAQMRLVKYNDGRASAEKRPFLALSEFALDEDDIDSATKILDPWENPFAYRYNHISGGKPATQWKYPSFLLISAGPEYNESIKDDDYFSGTMDTDGVPELDIDSPDYYFDGIRADNITNFAE